MCDLYNWYRFSHWLYDKKVPFLPEMVTYIVRILFSAYVPHTATIGAGTVLGYGGLGVVIHGRAVIGKNCRISQQVTIGGTSRKQEVPEIGDNVFIGAGAKVLGPVKIGNDVVIGANAVILEDVPSNCLAAGVPGRIVKTGITMSDYV